MSTVTYGRGDRDDPWILKTPSLNSEYQAWQDRTLDPPALVVRVGATQLSRTSDGHARLVPSQVSAMSQSSAIFRHTLPGLPGSWVHEDTQPPWVLHKTRQESTVQGLLSLQSPHCASAADGSSQAATIHARPILRSLRNPRSLISSSRPPSFRRPL